MIWSTSAHCFYEWGKVELYVFQEMGLTTTDPFGTRNLVFYCCCGRVLGSKVILPDA